MRKQQSLNGFWEISINERPFQPQVVPYSAACVGESLLKTAFDAEKSPRTVLVFEGISYRADVTLNGKALEGTMLPYCRYSYDVTNIIKEKDNEMLVSLRDRGMKYGPQEGWENYGGIQRNVYLEYTDTIYVQDAWWRTFFTDDYKTANCSILTKAEGASALRVTLKDRFGDAVAVQEAKVAGEETDVQFTVFKPLLWSPEHPNLYTLVVEALDEAGNARDAYTQKVGFKEFKANESQFLLNGQPYMLKGVCRHDMWGDVGMTLTDEMIHRDLSMIKGTGCNFVRLVHYPHDKRVVEKADELGLLICEESGLWWSDVTDPELSEPALKVMEMTILRDRSNVSIAFWLAFNECVFTEEFLKAATATCKKHDPYRMISGANCMTPKKTKEIFDAAEFDFYTYHPYGPDENHIMTGIHGEKPIMSLNEVYDILSGKPLLFTEWGGNFVEDNVFLFGRMIKNMMKANRDKRLGGFSYWEWADMYEHSRGEPGCFHGRLHEGLVNINREPHAILDVLTRMLADPGLLDDYPPEVRFCQVSVPQGQYTPVPLPRDEEAQEAEWKKMLKQSEKHEGFNNHPNRRMAKGPQLPWAIKKVGDVPMDLPKGRPVVIGDTYEMPLPEKADALYILGNVLMPWGYPQNGKKGDEVGKYTVTYTDGTTQEITLRNGVEVTTASVLAGQSRINPIAQKAEQAIYFTYDKNWEHYVVHMYCLSLEEGKHPQSLTVKCQKEGSSLLLFGVSAYQK